MIRITIKSRVVENKRIEKGHQDVFGLWGIFSGWTRVAGWFRRGVFENVIRSCRISIKFVLPVASGAVSNGVGDSSGRLVRRALAGVATRRLCTVVRARPGLLGPDALPARLGACPPTPNDPTTPIGTPAHTHALTDTSKPLRTSTYFTSLHGSTKISP